MKIFIFTRKELLELWRNYHLLIIAAVFIVFGIEGPLLAKLTPDILKMASTSQMTIKMPTPTSVEAWQQYFKNVTQVGIFILAVIFSGTISNELSRGTLVNLVTKGLPRYAIVVAKYLVAMFQWCFAIIVAFLINWGYTAYYFPDDKSPHIWMGMWPLLVFGFLFVAVIILGSTLSKSNYIGFLIAVIMFISLMLLNMFEKFQKYNPISLINDNLALVKGTEKISHIYPAIWINILAAVIVLAIAILILNKKKLW